MLVPTTCFNCESACGLLAYVDKDDLSVKKVEGNPAHPGSPRAQLRQGPGHHQPDRRPRAHPAPAAAHRGRAAAASGSRSPGTTRSTTSPAASVRRSWRAATRRSCTTWAVPARTASPSASCRPGACDGHNTHTNVCSSGARLGLDPVGRLRPALARPRQRQGHPAALQPPRDRPLLQPARPADHGGQAGAARSSSWSTRGCPTPPATPTSGSPPGRAARPPSCSRSPPTCCAPARSTSRSCAAGSTGRPTSRAPPRRASGPSRRSSTASSPTTPATPSSTPPRRPRSPSSGSRALAELVARLRPPARRAHLALRGGRQPAAAGRSRAALWFVLALTGSIGTPGGTSPNGWNKFIPHGPDMPAAHDHWNELTWPREYPLSHQRDVDPAAALPRRGSRPSRGLLLAGVQPDLDLSRRVRLDARAVRPRARLAATWR